MPTYKYTAKERSGKTLKGSFESGTKDEAIQMLRKKDVVIISLEEERKKTSLIPGLKFKKGVKLDEIVIFSRQLATMVDAGIPLVNALDILGEQMENQTFKNVILKIRDDVETGSSLSEALAKHSNIFSELFMNMVRAGESSGMLDEILDRVALYLEKTSSLQKKIKSALVYPIAVVIMALGITVFLMVKVIPVFKDIYEGFGAALPKPTAVLISISDFMTHYFYVAIGIAIAAGFALMRYLKSDQGKLAFDRFKLNVPIFGTLVRKIAVGKFTRTLSTLIRSGVPILNSLEIVGKTSGNKVMEIAVEGVRQNVKEGEAIAEPLGKSGVFPPMVVRMVSVGEQTGELEKMLSKIADFYDEQVDAAVTGLTSLIEPLIIAFLGIVVGGIVICMFLPILKITSVVSG